MTEKGPPLKVKTWWKVLEGAHNEQNVNEDFKDPLGVHFLDTLLGAAPGAALALVATTLLQLQKKAMAMQVAGK